MSNDSRLEVSSHDLNLDLLAVLDAQVLQGGQTFSSLHSGGRGGSGGRLRLSIALGLELRQSDVEVEGVVALVETDTDKCVTALVVRDA